MGNSYTMLSSSVAVWTPILWKCLLGWLSALGSTVTKYAAQDSCVVMAHTLGPSHTWPWGPKSQLPWPTVLVFYAQAHRLVMTQQATNLVAPHGNLLLFFSITSKYQGISMPQVSGSQCRVASGLLVVFEKAWWTLRCWIINDEQVLFKKWELANRLINLTSHE